MAPLAGDRYASLAAQASGLAAGDVTSTELVEAALARAEASQQAINPFRVLRLEAARAEAAAADVRLAAGERLPLLGVPVAIKDDTDIEGESTPFGCAGPFERKSDDCEAVRRLRASGAVVIGKTNTPEIGLYPWTEGRAFGETRNPWNTAYTPGGSSGGSAAAVAAGVVAGALGSDGAGSVRIPASWTNLVGIKPQRGRISTWPDPEAFNGITCIGPLARSVGDAALLLDVCSGTHPGDVHRPPPPAVSYASAASAGPPRRLRIAVSLRLPWVLTAAALDPEVGAAVVGVGERLARLGHDVVEADARYGPMGPFFAPRGSAGVQQWCRRVPDRSLLDPRTLATARSGRWMSGPVLRLARAAERPLAAGFGRIFRRFDVLLTPVTAVPPLAVGAAKDLGNWDTDKLMAAACPYAWPWNLTGWPAMSVPAGLVPGNLPVGAQLGGPAGSEALLLSLAAELEADCRWQDRHPDQPED